MGKTLNAALLASLLAGAASLQAEEWIDFGAPFAGSGGAGAALGRGAGGGYYNPANLSRRPWVDESIFTIEFDIPAGATAGIHGDSFRYIFDTVEKANDLYDRFQDGAFNTASNSLTFEDIQFAFEVFDALDQLDSLNGDGMYAATAAGLSARLANVILPRDAFGFSMAGFGLGAATAVVDLDSLRGYRLADESGATWEALIGIAVANSGQPAPSPTTPGGIQFSADLQAAGYSAATADTLAAQAEAAGMNFGGEGASILFDFLVNTLNGTGTSLESGANPLEGNQS
ncbi:MAG: hypothetical protein IT463_01025, partial [Planctomycetes bacterium]|nr:hypothetical protein [Planctomycetota bacterium]